MKMLLKKRKVKRGTEQVKKEWKLQLIKTIAICKKIHHYLSAEFLLARYIDSKPPKLKINTS